MLRPIVSTRAWTSSEKSPGRVASIALRSEPQTRGNRGRRRGDRPPALPSGARRTRSRTLPWAAGPPAFRLARLADEGPQPGGPDGRCRDRHGSPFLHHRCEARAHVYPVPAASNGALQVAGPNLPPPRRPVEPKRADPIPLMWPVSWRRPGRTARRERSRPARAWSFMWIPQQSHVVEVGARARHRFPGGGDEVGSVTGRGALSSTADRARRSGGARRPSARRRLRRAAGGTFTSREKEPSVIMCAPSTSWSVVSPRNRAATAPSPVEHEPGSLVGVVEEIGLPARRHRQHVAISGSARSGSRTAHHHRRPARHVVELQGEGVAGAEPVSDVGRRLPHLVVVLERRAEVGDDVEVSRVQALLISRALRR